MRAVHAESPLVAVPRIKPPARQSRRLWLIAALTIAGVTVALLVTRYFRAQDAAHIRELAQFSSAYAMECDVRSFSVPPSPPVRDAYLHSRALQQVVSTQQKALAAGASCAEVTRALRAADFPIALPSEVPYVPPTIRLEGRREPSTDRR